MSSLFIGVYRAMYDYTARDELELTIAANDLLYLLEKSDIDEWWTVKKRLPPEAGIDVNEPSGIVPSNYIEPAPVLHTAHALYDYGKQTQEELSFTEGTVFNVYDISDSDWPLVGLVDGSTYGYVPANYIQKDVTTNDEAVPGLELKPIEAFAPPPQHKSVAERELKKEQALDVEGNNTRKSESNRDASDATNNKNLGPQAENLDVYDNDDDDDDDVPPPMPARPTESSNSRLAPAEESGHTADNEFYRWKISELHRDKKTPVELAVSSDVIILKRAENTKLKRGEEYEYRWPISHLTNYNHEKKHLFLDFSSPEKSLHLYTNDKHVSEAIVLILGEYKGAYEARGLGEIARASSTKTSNSNKMIGVVMYRFKPEGSNELRADAGEKVYVLQAHKSKDWWLCEKMSKKKQGYIPASYIELSGTENMEGMVGKKDSLYRLFFSRDRLDRDKIRERDRVKRGKQKHSNDDNMPNFHRVRTWIDCTGAFKVEAELLSFKEDNIYLHKTNGVKIAVAAPKLSLEDLEYVERVCEISLQEYKDQVVRQAAKKANKQASSDEGGPSVPSKDGFDRSIVGKSRLATALINDVTPSKSGKPARTSSSARQQELEYDWFEFFLNCGVEIGNCQRYSLVFSKERMDESILDDITPTLLRSLGLREGDILRVMKHLDERFDRKRADSGDTKPGALFTKPLGELKNNSTVETTKFNASALPSSGSKLLDLSKIEDDAWAVKPAARSTEDLSKQAKPQYTGLLHDLIDIKPIEGKKGKATADIFSESTAPAALTGSDSAAGISAGICSSLPALEPTKTLTSNFQPLPASRTGGFIPVHPTGFIPVLPTGFMPIMAQPTGFVPIQATGGYGFVPSQTGTFTAQRTGPPLPAGPPPTTFGQGFLPTGGFVPLQTGTVTGHVTGNMAPLQTLTTLATQQLGANQGAMNQIIGQDIPSTTFAQPTGSRATAVLNNAFIPQSTFGRQITGGYMGANQTVDTQQNQNHPIQNQLTQNFGLQNLMSSNSYAAALTGSAPATFTNQATSNQPSFGTNVDGMTSMFQNTSIGVMPQPSIGAPQTLNQFHTLEPLFGLNTQNLQNQNTQNFGQQSFNQHTFGQQNSNRPNFNQQNFNQQSFGQSNFGQNFGHTTGQAGSGYSQNLQMGQTQLFGQPFGQTPMPPLSFNLTQMQSTLFGTAPKFDGFDATLQAQPTGVGFGNAPLQSHLTGKRANLQSATADNPFGF